MSSSRSPEAFPVALDAGPVTALHYAAAGAPRDATLILAHGAGAGQRSPFIVGFAQALASVGFDTVTFNFPYTERRRRLPDRAPVLESCYRAVVDETRRHVASAQRHLFIGGKSMGGRIASQLAAADPVLPLSGLVLLGYPLHPPGRPEQRRDAHLGAIGRPMLVVQGSRDTFGTAQEIHDAFDHLTPTPTLHIVEGGDHSFKVARAGPQVQAAIDDEVRRTTAEWMQAVIDGVAASRTQPS